MTARTAQEDPQRLAIAFAGLLRQRGVPVPLGSVALYVDALGALRLDDRGSVYWAGRASLVHRPEDLGPYDAAFGQFWLGDPPPSPPLPRILPVVLDLPPDEAEPDGSEQVEPGDQRTVVRYSAAEVLRDKDFAVYTPADYAEASALLSALRIQPPGQRSRRLRPGRHGHGGHPDLRRTVRRAMRTEGEAFSLAFQSPRKRLRRLVVVCDVSGSMEPYCRALLRFAHAAMLARGRVEVFALGTRLTRLSRQLHARDPDAALAAAARAVPDWSGGTRLGDGLRAFNDEWGVPGLARGAVVVICSDGWDRGDPAALGEQMARLHRITHQVVWVNPLKAAPGYAPLARGMAAALPWVDAFVEGHSLAALESLAEVIDG